VWVDTSYWVYGGHYEDVTERVWVRSGYTAYRDVKKWVDTSHYETRSYNVWVSSGYTTYYWVDTSHNVWVKSGYTASRWVDTSHSVWVKSGHTASRWVDTSHWETRYRTVRQAYQVWVSSGYWRYNRYGRYWVNTSHWETRYRNVSQAYQVYVRSGYTSYYWVDTSHWVWVSSGYTSYYWVDTSHWVWVKSGYTASRWVDTSHWETIYKIVWVESGYWTTVKETYWVDTSHWEDQKVWVSEGHYETRYRYVEDWQPCNVTFVYNLENAHPFFYCEELDKDGPFKGTINGKTYRYNKYYLYTYFLGHMHGSPDEFFYAIRYKCYEVLNGYKKEAYSVWVPGGHWKREWVDTSHLVKSGYWQSYNYNVWVDTSYMKTEGHWEDVTKRTWVDTSHWETETVWVDTSHWVSSGYTSYKDVWVEEGHYVEADLDPEGKVLHTEKWNENRINYNLSETGDPDKPRGYEIFFNGERFVLEADTLGDFQPVSVNVEFLDSSSLGSPSNFDTDLTNTGGSKWEGFIWDESFIYFHDRDCVFKFTAAYDYNGDKFEIEDEVTVYIARDYYWQLHRGF